MPERSELDTLDEGKDGETSAQKDARTVKKWLTEIQLAEKHFEKWVKQGKKAWKRYTSDYTRAEMQKYGKTDYNIFYSNVQTMQPALYARTPKVRVQRRFKDSNPPARVAANILERATTFAMDEIDFDESMTDARDDYLIPGRGQVWVRYVSKKNSATRKRYIQLQTSDDPKNDSKQPRFVFQQDGVPVEPQPLPEKLGKDDKGEFFEEEYEYIAREKICVDHIPWDRFLHQPAEEWTQVEWVAKAVQLRPKHLEEIFGKQIAETVDFTTDAEGMDEGEEFYDDYKTVKVWEIWDRETRKVYWITEGKKDKPLRVLDDPLGLENFFPCPKPLLSTSTSNSLIPIPDLKIYQDQADELRHISSRISKITKAIKVVGAYDAACKELSRIYDEGVDTALVDVKNWSHFATNNGFKGAMDFVPIEEPVKALQVLIQAREQVKADLYELTGMSDIVRGQSNPNETATAQQIKGNFATLRISDRQQEVQRFARDVIAIMGEVIAEHFQVDTLMKITGTDLVKDEVMELQTEQGVVEQPITYEDAVQLLRNDLNREFAVTIETD